MLIQDRIVSVRPYWVVKGSMDQFKALCQRFVALAETEPKCLDFAISFNGDEVSCREAYDGAEGLLHHVANVSPVLRDAAQIAKMTRVEVHATEEELAKLREPLSAFNPTYFTVLYGVERK